MPKVDIEVRICQYTRIGTEARWEPIDNGEYFDEVQKEFDELKRKTEELSDERDEWKAIVEEHQTFNDLLYKNIFDLPKAFRHDLINFRNRLKVKTEVGQG